MKPPVNLCIYNRPRPTILDRIWFLTETLQQGGYTLVCSPGLRPECLNLLIDDLIGQDIGTCEAFCRRYSKQVGIVLTHHIEMENGRFIFGSEDISDKKYIDNKAQLIVGLLALADSAFCFITLGELPQLRTWDQILPSRLIRRLPYPPIAEVRPRPTAVDHDVVFTGALTPHRRRTLELIGRRYKLLQSESASLCEDERAALYSRARVAVDIPVSNASKRVSPMRIMYGLRMGLPTIHLGTPDLTHLSKLALAAADLDEALQDDRGLYERQTAVYSEFVRSARNFHFPSGLLDAWAMAERLPT